MKITSVIIFKRNLLYDGMEGKFYEKVFEYSDNYFIKPIKFAFFDFEDCDNLKEIIGEDNFRQVVKNVLNATESISFKGAYSGTENLPLGYQILDHESNKYLIIASAGEFQSARFKVYLEGIWLLN